MPLPFFVTPLMASYNLMLVDSDAYTASVLVEDLGRRAFGQVRLASNLLELQRQIEEDVPDVVIFNFHSDRPDSLGACSTMRLMAPNAAVVVIVSPGPALKQARAWSKQTGSIDVIIEKPLSDERFFMVLHELLKTRHSTRQLEARAERLANLVPEGAIPAAQGDFRAEAEMFDAAVMFTDIRQSSQLILQMPAQEFFELLNELLSAQARCIGEFEGSVVKFTGDGVMAIFRGMGRSHLAMRCAIEVARRNAGARMPFGVGVAQGLVMAGLIGDSAQSGQRRQYDVIGATVHLAARLCSMAEAGSVMCTLGISRAARLDLPQHQAAALLNVRGFDRKIDCVVFNPLTSPQEQSP